MNTNYFLTEGLRLVEPTARRETERERRVTDFLAGSRILCFLRCLLFAFYRESNSSPRLRAFVVISGLDFVNLPSQTRLRGIAVRKSRIADNQMLDSGC